MIDWVTERQIKDSARIADVVGAFCQLRKVGKELTCACPIHLGNQLNHFKVNPAKNLYFCFVCNAGGDAVDFLMRYPGTRYTYPEALRWLADRYHITIDDKAPAPAAPKPQPAPMPAEPELPTLELPLSLVNGRLDTTGDTLCNWLRSLPWDERQSRRLEAVLRAYAVGHSAKDMTIFWQIDDAGKVRTGKLMRYGADGHRIKTGYYQDWVHSTLERGGRTDYYDSNRQRVRPCLFGLHLLNSRSAKSDTVNIVESEKTALICAIAHGSGNGLWMATGGMQFLSRERLDPLMERGMRIVIHPDHDGVEKWQEKVRGIGYKDIYYNNQYVDAYWRPEDGPKADAADIIVRLLMEEAARHTKSQLADIIAQFPAVSLLVDKFDLIEKKRNA